MENAAPKLNKMFSKLLKDTQKKINAGEISEETVLKTAAILGEVVVRAEIDATNSPPNSLETIQRKKSDKPLIDSGDMRKHVKGVVRAKTQ